MLWLELGRCQQALGLVGAGAKLVQAGAATQSAAASEAGLGAGQRLSERGFWARAARLVATAVSTDEHCRTSTGCLSAANEFDASDLHLVAGVPPAFRVNGEIILADEDALTEEDITQMADSLLNEQQKKKFEQEWELCISLLHQRRRAGARHVLPAQRPSRK